MRALLAGEQILDLRKGGIREEGRHFALRSTRVWLYPTVEHQERELVRPRVPPLDRRLRARRARRPGHPDRGLGRHRRRRRRSPIPTTSPRSTASSSGRATTPSHGSSGRARPAVGARAARPPARRAGHRPVARGVRRLHVVGRPRRPPGRSRIVPSEPALSDGSVRSRASASRPTTSRPASRTPVVQA